MKSISRSFSTSIRASFPSPSTPTRSSPFSSNFKNIYENQVERIPSLKNGTGKWPRYHSTESSMANLEREELEAELDDAREIERVLGGERSRVERVPIIEKPERMRRVVETQSFQGDELLRPIIPSGEPTIDDLYSLRPRRTIIPTQDTAPAVRVVYLKTWTSTAAKLDRSFNKVQLRRLAGPKNGGGLGLDVEDPRVSVTSGKRKFAVKPKKLMAMSKNELIRVLMVLSMGLTAPEKLPSIKKLPQITESIILSDRSLFLLLTPEGTSIKSLMTEHQVKLSFKRNAETSELSMIIKGAGPAVTAAADQVLALASEEHTRAIFLPNVATTLRPESYQTISRLAKVFIEPGKTKDTILATAIGEKDQSQVSQMLSLAFVQNAIESSVPVFLSLPPISPTYNSLQNKFSLYPFAPTTLPSWSITAASNFARLQSVRAVNEIIESKEEIELRNWERKMRFEDKSKRLPLSISVATSIAETLSSTNLDGKLEIRGEFGNWLLPIFYDGKGGDSGSLAGVFSAEKFTKWAEKKQGIFVAKPPKGLLSSAGIYSSSPSTSPFDALLPFTSSIPSLSTSPKISGFNTRRLIYRPVVPIQQGESIKRIEIDFLGGSNVEVRKIEEKRVRFAVPDGSSDFQISISNSLSLVLHNLIDFPTEEPSLPPSYLTYLSTKYILDLDLALRATTVESAPGVVPVRILKQERWRDEISGNSGSKTETILGETGSVQEAAASITLEAVAKMEQLCRIGLH